jgi:hypothetical protein
MHFLDSIVRPRRLFLFRDLTLALRVNDICILSGERLLFHGDLLLSEARESRGGGVGITLRRRHFRIFHRIFLSQLKRYRSISICGLRRHAYGVSSVRLSILRF